MSALVRGDRGRRDVPDSWAPVDGVGLLDAPARPSSSRRHSVALLSPQAAIARSRLRAGARGGVTPVAVLASLAHADRSLANVQVTLQAGWHPGLAQLLGDAGARVGRVGASVPLPAVSDVLAVLPPGSLVPRARTRLAAQRRALAGQSRAELVQELRAELAALPGGERGSAGLDLGRRIQTRAHGGVVTVWADGDVLRLRAGLVDPLRVGADELALGSLARGALSSVVMSLSEALAWMEAAAESGLCVVDVSSGALADAARRLDRSVVVTGVRGAPGLALVVTGRRADQRHVIEAARVGDVDGFADGARRTVEMADVVRDVTEMGRAGPTGRDGLHEYQDHFVSRYLATELGVVNALAPGLGKTVCAAHALRERGPHSRALIVVPAPLREQWVAELATHHRRARVEVICSKADVARALRATALPGPVCVLVSFDLARVHVDALAGCAWTDLVVDEAAFLKSRRSARVRALWQLRQRAERTMVLTGTPIDRSVDDLAPLVAFSRNDPAMFDGAKLSQRAKAVRLSQVLGPTVFRTSTTEAGLPAVRWEIVPVELSDAELALVAHTVARLKAAYARYQHLDATGAPTLAAMGAVLRALNVVRAATCDPAAVPVEAVPSGLVVPGRMSGMFAGAPPAKRAYVAEAVADHVAADGQALVCCDFLPAGQALAETLAARGASVAVVSSRLSASARRRTLAEFDRGETSTLVLSGLARQGLNLQRADLVVHYDLPLSSAALTQRVGRALRLGSTASLVRAVVPVAPGTVDEILVELVRDAQARAADWLDGVGGANASHGALVIAQMVAGMLGASDASGGSGGLDLDGLAR